MMFSHFLLLSLVIVSTSATCVTDSDCWPGMYCLGDPGFEACLGPCAYRDPANSPNYNAVIETGCADPTFTCLSNWPLVTSATTPDDYNYNTDAVMYGVSPGGGLGYFCYKTSEDAECSSMEGAQSCIKPNGVVIYLSQGAPLGDNQCFVDANCNTGEYCVGHDATHRGCSPACVPGCLPGSNGCCEDPLASCSSDWVITYAPELDDRNYDQTSVWYLPGWVGAFGHFCSYVLTDPLAVCDSTGNSCEPFGCSVGTTGDITCFSE